MTLHTNPDLPLVALEVDAAGQFVLVVSDRSLGGAGHQARAVLPPEVQEALVSQAAELTREKTGRQTAMEVQVSALRYANYGDHAQMDHRALVYDPTETVESLVLRGLKLTETYGQAHLDADHIVLRVIEGTEPDRVGSDVPPF